MTAITVCDTSIGPDLAAPTRIICNYSPLSRRPRAGRLLGWSQAETALMEETSIYSRAGFIYKVSESSTEHGSDHVYPLENEGWRGKDIHAAAAIFAGVTLATGVGLAANRGLEESPEFTAFSLGLISLILGKRRGVQANVDLPIAVAQRLQQLANLPKNWNSYGAPTIDTGALAEARRIIQIACGRSGLGLPAPGVSPGAHGGVGIEWATGGGIELILDIPPNDTGSFVLVVPDSSGNEVVTEDKIGTNEHLESLLRHITA